MPEVGIYDSPEVNAFATGPVEEAQPGRGLDAASSARWASRRSRASSPTRSRHIANGDMVTMTLIQGVVNAFVLYLSHIVAMIARNALSCARRARAVVPRRHRRDYAVFIAAQIVFGIIGSMVTAWFSRQREFRADAGGAALAGRGSMVAALRRLHGPPGPGGPRRTPSTPR